MEIQNNVLKTPKQVFSQTKEQAIEADLFLPDYYPEISKIMDCSVSLSEEAVTLTADKISVSGVAKVCLVYTSAENELSVYESAVKYTKTISGGQFETGDVCVVHQNVTSVNFRAVSSRKAEVRASAAVTAQVLRMDETKYICNAESETLQKKNAVKESFCVSAFAVIRSELEESISLPAPKQSVRGILRQSVKITLTEVNAVSNKLMLSGNAEITFVSITNENAVSRENVVNLPFTQIKELYGVAEGDICNLAPLYAEASIDLKSGGENEAGVLIRFGYFALSGRNTEFRFLEDAYAVHADIGLKRCEQKTLENVSVLRSTIAFRGEAQTYDVEIAEICDKCVSDISYSVAPAENGGQVNGSLMLKLLAKTADGAFYCFSRSCSFESAEEALSGCMQGVSLINPTVLSVEKTQNGIRWNGELELCFAFSSESETELIADIVEGEPVKRENAQKIVLYYGAAGEEYWEIAKENRTALSAMMELNGLEGSCLKEDQLLVFRS